MRVTFVHPAGQNFVLGQPDVTLLVNRMAPLGILQMAAWLDRLGHTTFVHDCLGPQAPRGVAKNTECVLATDPDLVAFSATTSAFLDAYDMAVLVKRKRPHVKVVFGGAHVSAVGASLLQHFPEVDCLCMGEGEGLMGDLASGKAPEQIGNLAYRDGEHVVGNPRRERIANLDELPFPAYEKLVGFPDHYHLPLFSFTKRHGATMVTSRGCTYACAYCDRSVFERRYTCNSPGYIWEHMRRLRDDFGVHHVNFYDDLFTANRLRIREFCDLLIRHPLGMNFNCAVRVGHADASVLSLLKRAGCFQVSVGIESGHPQLLARHKSKATLEAIGETIKRVHAAGLRAKGLFIFGLPGETPDTVRTTSDFIESLKLDELNISKFSPFPGAPLWAECIAGEDGKVHQDWRLMNCLQFTYVPKAFHSKDQMDLLYNQCIQRFFRGKHYQRLFRKRLWEHRWSLFYVLRHLPAFARANRHFKPRRTDFAPTDGWPAPHPFQASVLNSSRRPVSHLQPTQP